VQDLSERQCGQALPAAECGSPLLRGDQTNPFLHDVKDAGGSRRIRNTVIGVTPLPARSPSHPSPEWWSQTGSNRRPPACKAGALPTELWPQHLTDPIRSNASPPEPIAKDHSPRPARPKHERQQSIHQALIGWWAWVDSNYRPHAYQACALTT
jgi:hypothetical protein